MESFILTYGYWIMFAMLSAKSLPIVGNFISGNSALFLCGFLAGSGEFRISVVLGLALLAVILGDSLMFVGGKYFSDKFPELQNTQGKFQAWLNKTKQGTNKITYFYMHVSFLRSHLPFVLGFKKMSNLVWAKKVVIAAILFVPVNSMLGFVIGAANLDGPTKAVITAIAWLISIALVAKISHQIYSSPRA